LGIVGGATSQTLAEMGLFGLNFVKLSFARPCWGFVVSECFVGVKHGFCGDINDIAGGGLNLEARAYLAATGQWGSVGFVIEI
jgi:hypothetical protein